MSTNLADIDLALGLSVCLRGLSAYQAHYKQRMGLLGFGPIQNLAKLFSTKIHEAKAA